MAAAKMSILFVLLALCVAASMQMPDHGTRSRVRRQDNGAEEPEKPEAPAPAATGEADGSDGGSPSSPGGGGFTGIGGGGSGGGGSFPSSGGGLPGQDLFSSFIQAIFANGSPGSSFWQQASNFIPGKSDSSKSPA